METKTITPTQSSSFLSLVSRAGLPLSLSAYFFFWLASLMVSSACLEVLHVFPNPWEKHYELGLLDLFNDVLKR